MIETVAGHSDQPPASATERPSEAPAPTAESATTPDDPPPGSDAVASPAEERAPDAPPVAPTATTGDTRAAAGAAASELERAVADTSPLTAGASATAVPPVEAALSSPPAETYTIGFLDPTHAAAVATEPDAADGAGSDPAFAATAGTAAGTPPEQPAPACNADARSQIDEVREEITGVRDVVTDIHTQLAVFAETTVRLTDMVDSIDELRRLRARDTELIARLHDDVTRLRAGELAAALTPVVTGMLKLYDLMVSLGALIDPNSVPGLLRTQLLQVLDDTCGVAPFTPAVGDRFDAARHNAVRRLPTADAAADRTVANTVKAGFARADGTVVRVAHVEVHRRSG